VVKTNTSIEDLQFLLEIYEETNQDSWLAGAAKVCLESGIPLPAIVHRYLISLLSDVIHGEVTRPKQEGTGPKQKVKTIVLRDRYLETMREIQYLTGTTPEDAAERIINSITMEDEDDDDLRKEGTLMNWWNNRPERYDTPKRYDTPTSIDDLYHNSYEQAVDGLRPFLSAEVSYDGRTTLKIKKELFDQEQSRQQKKFSPFSFCDTYKAL